MLASRKRKQIDEIAFIEGFQICQGRDKPGCGQSLPVKNFRPGRRLCKSCEYSRTVTHEKERAEKRESEACKPVPEGFRKQCFVCKDIYPLGWPLSEFGAKERSPDGYDTVCMACRRDQANSINAKKYEIINASKLKQDNKCMECKSETPYLYFAHFKREEKHVHENGKRLLHLTDLCLDDLHMELLKGRFLCGYCERKETQQENTAGLSTKPSTVYARKRVLKRRELVRMEIEKRGKCLDCELKVDGDHPYFEFDHLDGENKVACVSELVRQQRPVHEIQAEMNKCELVCRECHRKRTDTRREIAQLLRDMTRKVLYQSYAT